MVSVSNAHISQRDPSSGASQYNAMRFLVSQMLAKISTAMPVQVVAVTNSGGTSPVGFVDVVPMINQMDGANRPVPRGKLHRLPYLRIQGGANAIILDPEVGDIGLSVTCDRDTSAVKNSKQVSNPGSGRILDCADGFYLGGFLNAEPTQFIAFNSSGITLTSAAGVTVNGPLTVNGDTSFVGATDFAGQVMANGHRIDESHTHGGVSPGGGNTGVVT